MFRIATALTALAALATAAPAPQSSRGITSGSLTWYTEGIGQAFTACGTMNTLTDVSHSVTLSFEAPIPSQNSNPLFPASRLCLRNPYRSQWLTRFPSAAHRRPLGDRLRRLRKPQRKPGLRKEDPRPRPQRQLCPGHGRRPLRRLFARGRRRHARRLC